MKLPLLFSLQLILFEVSSYSPSLIYKYSTALKAKIATTENNLLSYQSDEKEEFDNRPSYIHRAQVTDNHPQKLLEFVYTVFPDVKRTQAKQWLHYNSLLVNDEPQTKHDLSLRLGDWISVRGGKSKGNFRSKSSEGKKSYGALPNGLKILFEDEALFIVEKPCGISVSSAHGKEKFSNKPSLKTVNSTSIGLENKITKKVSNAIISNTKTVHSVVSSFLGKRAGSTDSKVFVVNRLEDDESGLVIFAKSVASKEYLLKNWNTFGIVYNVVCEGLFFPQQGTIKTYMDETGSLVTCSPTKSETAKSSPLTISHYRTLDSVSSTSSLLLSLNSKDAKADIDFSKNKIDDTQSYSILEVSLDTTRKDQIRSQLSYLNHSVCGDYKYGPLAVSLLENNSEEDSFKDNHDDNSDHKSIHDPIRRLGIHFSEIRMTHPYTKDSLTMTSNSPSSFNDLIKRIQSQTSSSAKHDLFSLTSEFRNEKILEIEDGGNNEDGDSDSLQKGSQKHSADSKNNKVKVFSLTEFLGPRAQSSGGKSKSNTSDPPSNADTAPKRSFKKKR